MEGGEHSSTQLWVAGWLLPELANGINRLFYLGKGAGPVLGQTEYSFKPSARILLRAETAAA